MKKFCIIFVSLFIITLAGFSFSACGGVEKHGVLQMQTQDFLRIHIRADSNLHEAQAVKYLVKDALVKYLVPLVAKYSNKLSISTLSTIAILFLLLSFAAT